MSVGLCQGQKNILQGRQMGKKIEKAVLDMNEAAQQKTAAAPLKKEDLATILNDLFSNKK